VDAVLPRLALRARVAQMVVPAVDPADTAALRRAGGWVRTDSVGGVLLLPGRGARRTAAAVAALRAGAPVPLLVAADVDGGAGALAPEGTDFPAPAVLAALGRVDESRETGTHAGREARALGVDLALVSLPGIGEAPPPGLPVAGEPAAEAVAAYLAGLRGAGVLAGVRLFPPRPEPSDTAPVPVLRWDRARLEAVELPVARRALAGEGGADAALLPVLALPALTGDSTPLALSPTAVAGMLRRDLGFGGLAAAEVGPGSALARVHGEAGAAVLAVAAGADLVLGAADPRATVAALVAAVEAGRIPAGRIEAAARRVLAAKDRLRSDAPPPVHPDSVLPLLRTEEAVEAARAALDGARVVLGPRPAALLQGCRAPLLLARPGDVPLFVREAAARIPALRPLQPAPSAPADSVPAAEAAAVRAADCWLVVETAPGSGAALLDRARRAAAVPDPADTAAVDTVAADTAAADSAVARPDPPTVLVRLTAAPPDSLPPVRSVVLAWGAGREAQHATARALADRDDEDAEAPEWARWPAAPVLRPVDPADVAMDEAGLARADAAIRAAVEAGTVPGAALAVGRRGGLVRLRGYGRTAAGGAEVSATETLYDVASLTKVAATTAAVMALADEGRIRLDGPVRRYLPGFTGKWKGNVTVRHLLTHTAGLPAGEWLYGSTASPEAALRRAMRAPLVRAPGQRMVYSDFGFILLGAVVEAVAGEPMDRYLARRVYAPLGMESTLFLPPDVLRPFSVPTAQRSEREYPLVGTVHDGNAFRLGGVAGHAGLFSTAADLAVLAQTMLNGGSYGTHRVYSPETVRTFTTSRARIGKRALGWDVPAQRSSAGSYFTPRSYGHTGFTGTSVWIDPERDVFVVLLTNRTYDNSSSRAMLELREQVHDAVSRSITGETVRPRPGSPVAVEEERRARAERERARRRRRRR
jgi:beta-N-acetylhexosaminidase